MSWRTQLEEHPVWQEIEHILNVQQELQEYPDSRSDMDTQLRDMLTEYLGARKSLDSTITPALLDRLLDVVRTITNQITQTGGRLSDASLLETLGTHLRDIPLPSRARLQGLGAKANEIENQLNQTQSDLENRLNVIRQELSRELETLQLQRAEFIELTGKQNAERLDELQGHLEATVEEVKSNAQSADARIEALNVLIENSQEAIKSQSRELSTAFQEFTKRETDVSRERETEWHRQLEEVKSEASQELEKLKEHQAQARTVLESMGVEATASSYSQYAQEQRKSANTWRWIAVGLFIFAFLWFLLASLTIQIGDWVPFADDKSDVVRLLMKWGGTAALIAAGYFASRESGAHRREERDAKQVELSLAALEPFIANMNETPKEELKQATARAIFVLDRNASRASKKSRTYNSEEAVPGLITLASDVVKKLPGV